MDVFEAFPEALTPYTFLELGQGGVLGNGIVAETPATGIFKERNGMSMNTNMETVSSTATLHMRPNEPFVSNLSSLVGHGVQINGKTYRIIGYPGGDNYDTGKREHIRLILKAESIGG